MTEIAECECFVIVDKATVKDSTSTDLSRLTNASGMSMEHNSDGGDVFSSYSMGMEYNIMSSPLLYDLTITSTSGTKSTENAYLYGDIQPGTPVKVGDAEYKYDASGNPVKYVDPDGEAPWDNENIRKAIQHVAESPSPDLYDVKLVDGKYGKDAHVVYLTTGEVTSTYLATQYNQRSAIGNIIQSCNQEGTGDCANRGTITTADFRGVADFCEGVSDACDATGTLCITTGVGAAVGGTLYGAGTVAGYVSDAINIGVDIYEGKYKNAFNRIANDFVSGIFGHKMRTGIDKVDQLLQKGIDKLTDTCTNKTLQDD